MIKADEITIKSTFLPPSFKSEKVEIQQKDNEQNVTNLANLPISSIGIKTPMSYNDTGKIEILDGLKANTYKLANGQKVIILPKKGPTVVKTYVNVGSMNEPDNLRGISHYIEHNLFNGTNDLKAGEFFNNVNKLGASTNASTSFSTTDYYIKSQLLKEGDLEEKIKLHADMLQNPTFTPDMLEKERGPVISEISMVMDIPQNTAMNRALKNLFQIDTKSPDLIAGTVENIKNVTREDVVNYFNTHYTPDNFTTVITGDVKPEEAIGLISKYFTKELNQTPKIKKYEQLTPIEKSIRMDEESDKTQNSTIAMAFVGPQNNNTKEKAASSVLLELLTGTHNSRLPKALEQLHIDVNSGIEKVGNKPDTPKAILFTSDCSPDKVDKAINIVYKEIFDIQNGEISQKEFDAIKKRLKIKLSEISEISEEINGVIGSFYLDNDLNGLADYDEILNSLEIKDIQEAAKKYLNLNKASIAVINPSRKALEQTSLPVSFGNSYTKKEAYNTSKLQTYKLSNNTELTTNPCESDITVFSMKIGQNIPAATKPAVASVLSLMLNRGTSTKSKEEFFNEAEDNNIEITFTANNSGISVMSKSSVDDSLKALEMAKEVLFSPNLSQENLEFAKSQLKEQVLNTPKEAHNLANAELFKHLPFTATREEFIKSIDNLTLDDIKGLYAYINQKPMGTVMLSAPINKKPEILNTVTAELNSLPKFEPNKYECFNSFVPLEKNKIILQEDERNQADIIKSYKFKINENIADTAKFSLLNIILGANPNSRLFMDLREKKKLAYRVRSNLNYNGNTGVMSLSIKTTTDNPNEGNGKLDNLKKSLIGFDKNTDLLKTNLISDEELDSAKLYLKTNILNETETTAGKTITIMGDINTPYGINRKNLLIEEIDKVTKQDIKDAANYIFSNPSVTSIVASKKTIEHYIKTTK